MAYPGAQTVHRALAFLKAFTDEDSTWTMTDLAARAQISKATAHRLLAALEGEGFLTKAPVTGEYRLGHELIVLGARALRTIDLRELAHGEMEALARATGEAATLEILVDSEVLIIDKVRGQSILGAASSMGTRRPAHATATGKVLLALSTTQPPGTTGHFHRFTSNTLVTWEELSQALDEVRNQGYGTNIEELEAGFVSIAAPVRDRDGNTVAAVSLGGPVHRMDEGRIPELANLLSAAGGRISKLLGFNEAS